MKVVGVAPRTIIRRRISSASSADSAAPLSVGLDARPRPDGPNEEFELGEISKRQGGKVPDPRKIIPRCSFNSASAARTPRSRCAPTPHHRRPRRYSPPGVAYHPRVTAFAKQLEFSGAIPMDGGPNPQRMMEAFLQFQKDRERNLELLAKKVEELRKQAEGNIELVLRASAAACPTQLRNFQLNVWRKMMQKTVVDRYVKLL